MLFILTKSDILHFIKLMCVQVLLENIFEPCTWRPKWEDLHYHDNTRHPSFNETAISRGYLKDDKEWDDIFTVIGQCALPSQMRVVCNVTF